MSPVREKAFPVYGAGHSHARKRSAGHVPGKAPVDPSLLEQMGSGSPPVWMSS